MRWQGEGQGEKRAHTSTCCSSGLEEMARKGGGEGQGEKRAQMSTCCLSGLDEMVREVEERGQAKKNPDEHLLLVWAG